MRKVLNGKLFDTKSAEFLCEHSFSNPSDFKNVSESLYKSPNGQFFIKYSGGPMSEYGVRCGQNELSGSSGIRLVSDDEAKVFFEAHGTSDDYVKAFGEPELG